MYTILVICIFNSKIIILLKIFKNFYYVSINFLNSLYFFIVLLNNLYLFYKLKFISLPIVYCFIFTSIFFYLPLVAVSLRVLQKFFKSTLFYKSLNENLYYFSCFYNVNVSNFFLFFPYKFSKFILIYYNCVGFTVYTKLNLLTIPKIFCFFSKLLSEKILVIFLNKLSKKNINTIRFFNFNKCSGKIFFLILLQKLYLL